MEYGDSARPGEKPCSFLLLFIIECRKDGLSRSLDSVPCGFKEGIHGSISHHHYCLTSGTQVSSHLKMQVLKCLVC